MSKSLWSVYTLIKSCRLEFVNGIGGYAEGQLALIRLIGGNQKIRQLLKGIKNPITQVLKEDAPRPRVNRIYRFVMAGSVIHLAENAGG